MPDMIVKLYDLPSLEGTLAEAAAQGVSIRPAFATEEPQVADWAKANFIFWAPEVAVTFHRLPISCLLAVEAGEIIGFATYDATCKNFFGPTGVLPEHRGRGIGKALLIATLHAQRAQGYAYAIIGGVGPADFYAKVVGAQLIDHSTPGILGESLPFKPAQS